MANISRYNWCIKDVVEHTGLPYDYIYDALHSGELEGIVAPRFLRTNEQAVAAWLESLKAKPPSPPATSAPPVRPKRKGKGSAYSFLDPDSFGSRGG